MSSVLKIISLLAFAFVVANAALAEEDQGRVSEQALLVRYANATQAQQSTMRGATMEVDIDASVPKLNKNGRLHALRNISNLGKITYHMLGFNGDGAIKKEVIARYLAADAQAQEGPNLSITGSLATILWLQAIRREGADVSFWQFLKVGAVTMPLALIAALVARMALG